MSKAEENSLKKYDYEVLFKDSPEYFAIKNAKMIQEKKLIRFICFHPNDLFKEDVWFPISNIHRIKRGEPNE